MVRRLSTAVTALSLLIVACAGPGPASQPPTMAGPTPTLATEPTPATNPTPTAQPTTQPTAQPSSTPAPNPSASAPPSPSSPAAATPIASIEGGFGPCAVAELDGDLWVTNYNQGTLSQIDGSTNEVVGQYDLGVNPCGITALDGALWIGILGEQSLVRFDPETKAVTDTIALGGQSWDVQHGHGSVWVAVLGPDTVVRIDPDSREIVATVDVGEVVVGLAVTATEVWVASQLEQLITRINAETNEVSGTIEFDTPPSWFAVGENTVLTTFPQRGTAAVLDAGTGETIAATEVGFQPRDPGFVGGNYWVANQGDGSVHVLHPTTGASLGSFRVPLARGIFVAEGLLGDGWILHFAGSTVDRFSPDTGL